MRRITLIALAVSLFALPAAFAQNISVYGTVAPAYLNHLLTISGGASPQTTLSGQWFVGANAGVTLNFAPVGPVRFGLDFRGGPEIGTPGLGSALGGLKLEFPSPAFHLKPYGQLSMGFLEQRHQTGSGTSAITDNQSYFAVELIGGVDYPIARHVDLRVVEVDLGATKVAVNNGTQTNSSPKLAGLHSGIVFTF